MDFVTSTQIAANITSVMGLGVSCVALLLTALTYLDGRESPTAKKNRGLFSAIISGFSKKI